MTRPLRRSIAAALSFALLQASFAPQAWAAVAALPRISAPVVPSAAAGAVRAAGAVHNHLAASSFGSLAPASFSASPAAALSASEHAVAVSPSAAPAAAESAVPAPYFTPLGLSHADEGAPLQAGPLTESVGARVAPAVEQLRRFKDARRDPGLIRPVSAPIDEADALSQSPERLAAPTDARLAPAAATGSAAPASRSVPESSSSEAAPEPKKGWLGKLGKWLSFGAVTALIAGMLVQQVGLEAQGAAMAQLTEISFGDFSILAQVAIFAQVGSLIGQQVSQAITRKLGLAWTFYGAHTLRALSIGAMIVLLGTGHMPLALMYVFYLFNGVVTGIASSAEATIRKLLLAKNGVSQQSFRTWWQLLAEIVAVPIPMIMGALVPVLGPGLITALYPATIVAGLFIFFMFKVVPLNLKRQVEKLDQDWLAEAAKNEPPSKGFKGTLKQIFKDMEGGRQYVSLNGVLKWSLIGAVIFDLMNLLIYRLIAPGFGKLVAGSEGMAVVQGNVVSMFSLGGLLLALTFLGLAWWAKRQKKAEPTPEEKAAAERKSMLRWMMLGIPALALLGVMGFNIPLALPAFSLWGVDLLPTSVLAAALIPFGFFKVAASIKLNSFFNDKIPNDPEKAQKAISYSGSLMTAISIILMVALKPLFGAIPLFNPFPYLAMALIPVGALLFFVHRRLSAATKDDAGKTLAEPSGPSKGGYAGFLLGVLAAAVISSMIPSIPLLAGLHATIAGLLGGFFPSLAPAALAALGKFGVNLALALGAPALGFGLERLARRYPAPFLWVGRRLEAAFSALARWTAPARALAARAAKAFWAWTAPARAAIARLFSWAWGLLRAGFSKLWGFVKGLFKKKTPPPAIAREHRIYLPPFPMVERVNGANGREITDRYFASELDAYFGSLHQRLRQAGVPFDPALLRKEMIDGHGVTGGRNARGYYGQFFFVLPLTEEQAAVIRAGGLRAAPEAPATLAGV